MPSVGFQSAITAIERRQLYTSTARQTGSIVDTVWTIFTPFLFSTPVLCTVLFVSPDIFSCSYFTSSLLFQFSTRQQQELIVFNQNLLIFLIYLYYSIVLSRDFLWQPSLCLKLMLFLFRSAFRNTRIKGVSQTQPCDICNNIIFYWKSYVFLLYLNHLQALKGQINIVGKQCIIYTLYRSDPWGPEDDSGRVEICSPSNREWPQKYVYTL
jgi:hypothetical protein